MNVSINEIEFSTRVWNVMNEQSIGTITELAERCVEGRKFVGLKGRWIGTAVNFEIAEKLHALGFIDSMDGIKLPKSRFLPPTFCHLLEIEKIARINLDTKLVEMDWHWKELKFLNSYSNDRCGRKSALDYIEPPERGRCTVLDFILQFLRIDNKGRIVLRTWGYRCEKQDLEFGLKLVREKLVQWGVPYVELAS